MLLIIQLCFTKSQELRPVFHLYSLSLSIQIVTSVKAVLMDFD